MSYNIIEARDISKLYRLGTVGTGSLKNDVNRWWTTKVRGLEDPYLKVGAVNDRSKKGASGFVWSLKDIDFDIKQGEAVGIIGKNGAGKSTLLKILSRVTQPTKGHINVRGRIASLLEVGTGFHPELTGRENVYLNGAIMGMSRHEVSTKLDEIVDFAGVAAYIDTPVKRYSTGMHVRLGFAVAAHLEPEIMVIDEVLAVGDSVFQKKCIDKMTDVCRQGRTILFVSHNMAAVKALCSKGIVLENGQKVFEGSINDAIANYNMHADVLDGKVIDFASFKRDRFAQQLEFDKVEFENNPIQCGETIKLRIKLKTTGSVNVFPDLDMGINIIDKNKNIIIHCANKFINADFNHTNDSQEYEVEIENILKPDIYNVNFFIRSKDVIQDWIEERVKLVVQDPNPYGFMNTGLIQGSVVPQFQIKQMVAQNI